MLLSKSTARILAHTTSYASEMAPEMAKATIAAVLRQSAFGEAPWLTVS
jgi:hypothetical protein